MRKLLLAAAAVALAALGLALLVGPFSGSANSTGSAAATSSSDLPTLITPTPDTSPDTLSSSPSQTAEETGDADWPEPPAPSATPTPSESAGRAPVDRAEQQAMEVALRAATAFARPAPDQVQHWWPRLAPLLTGQGRDDYLGTDPTQVPYRTVTGPASIDPTEREVGEVMVWVPTDAGRYEVSVFPDGDSDRWLVAHIVPASWRELP